MSFFSILQQLQSTFWHPVYKPLCLVILILTYRMRQPKNSEVSVSVHHVKRPHIKIIIPKKYAAAWEKKYSLASCSFFKEVMSATPEGQQTVDKAKAWWNKEHIHAWKDPDINIGPMLKKTWSWIQDKNSETQDHSDLYQTQWAHIITWWNSRIEQINANSVLAEVTRTKNLLRSVHPDKRGCTQTTQLLIEWKKHLEELLPLLHEEWDPESNAEPITLREICVQYAVTETRAQIDAAKEDLKKKIQIIKNYNKYQRIIAENTLYHNHTLQRQKKHFSVQNKYEKSYCTRPLSPSKVKS